MAELIEVTGDSSGRRRSHHRGHPPRNNTHCEHNLASVSDSDVLDVLTHERKMEPSSPGPELSTLRQHRFFIAACLHQSQAVLPHWNAELIRLVVALQRSEPAGSISNVFVSVYESGSTDLTGDYLEALDSHLEFLGVPHRVERGSLVRGSRNRIDFLAEVRNKALEPLYMGHGIYDQVVWLNDVFFCADGILQLTYQALPIHRGGLGADAVCGMDYSLFDDPRQGPSSQCGFYDIWVAHDIAGGNFEIMTKHQDKTAPFQVFSCWNGMVTFNAQMFQKQGLSFRRNQWQLGECSVSETELLMRDMWKVGHGKIVVVPSAASAYEPMAFDHCARHKQPIDFHHVDQHTFIFQPAPDQVSCCPLQENATYVDFRECFSEEWDRFDVQGLPLTYTTLLRSGPQLSLGCVAFLIFVVWLQLGGGFASCPLVSCLFIVGVSSMLEDIISHLASTAISSPSALLISNLILSSLVMLCMNGGMDLIREILAKQGAAVRWSLVAPLTTVGLLTSRYTSQGVNAPLLLAVHSALPLVTLIFEHAVFGHDQKRRPMSIGSVFALNTIALGTLFYCFNDLTGAASRLQPYAVLCHGLLSAAARFAMKYLLVDKDMDLSYPALFLVGNASQLVLAVGFLAWNQDLASSHSFGNNMEVICWLLLLACIFLCQGYYANILLRTVPVTTVLTLHVTAKVATIFAVMCWDTSRMKMDSGSFCFFSLVGCIWYFVDASQGLPGIRLLQHRFGSLLFGAPQLWKDTKSMWKT